jgi:RTX calcium-binding nonapeptide repeat (4 copies)
MAIVGTAGNDFLQGDILSQEIYGLAGADTINGGGGGNDSLYGNSGNDIITGNAATAIIYGGQDNDNIQGTNFGDFAFGDLGNDTITGLLGVDQISGLDGNDRIFGADGNDSLFGNIGSDIISGDGGNDSIWGGQNNDSLEGNAGNDYLRGDLGGDTLRGGGGSDRFVIDAESGAVDVVTDFTGNLTSSDTLTVLNAPGHYAEQSNTDMVLKFSNGVTFAVIQGRFDLVSAYNSSPHRVALTSSADPLTDYSAAQAESETTAPEPAFDYEAYRAELDLLIAQAKLDPSITVVDLRDYPDYQEFSENVNMKAVFQNAITALKNGQPIPDTPGVIWADKTKVTIADLQEALHDKRVAEDRMIPVASADPLTDYSAAQAESETTAPELAFDYEAYLAEALAQAALDPSITVVDARAYPEYHGPKVNSKEVFHSRYTRRNLGR